MKRVLVLASIFISFVSFNQVNVDSLMGVWRNTTKDDTTRINALHTIAWDGFLFVDPDSALFYADLHYNFAKKKKLNGEMARALKTKGVSYYFRQDFDTAIKYYQRSLRLYKKAIMPDGSVGDGFGVSAIYNNLGAICQEQGKYDESMEYHLQGISIKEEIDDQKGLAISYTNIGNIQRAKGVYDKAIRNHMKSLKISEANHDIRLISSSYINIGVIYKEQGQYTEALEYYNKSLEILKGSSFSGNRIKTLNNIGSVATEMEDYSKSLEYYRLSLSETRELGDRRSEATILGNIGNVYFFKGDYETAKLNYTQSLEIQKEIGSPHGIGHSLNLLAAFHHEIGEFDVAIKHNLHALEIAENIGAQKLKKDILHALYLDYKAFKKNGLALEVYEEFVVVRDELESDENKQEIIRQKYKYDYEKEAAAIKIRTEEKLKLLKVEREREEIKKYTLFGGLGFLLITGLVFFNRFRVTQKQKKIIEIQKADVENKNIEIEKSLKEKETLLKEIHHRVKNNLQVISSLLSLQADRMTDEKALKAILESQSRVKSMALVHQNLYQTDHLSDIDFQKYLEQLTGNISAMNKNGHCDVALNVNANTYSFNIETAVPLGLIVNELVSNSYKHAFSGKSRGRIIIEIGNTSNKNYYLSIKDDGNGIQGEFDIKKSKSLGLKLVTILARQLKGKVEVHQDNGTLFLIHFHQISKSS